MPILRGLRKYHQWRENWRLVNPIYDEQECPQCAALCSGKEAKWKHREEHMKDQEFKERMERNIRVIAEKLGANIRYADEIDDDNTESDEEENTENSDGYVVLLEF